MHTANRSWQRCLRGACALLLLTGHAAFAQRAGKDICEKMAGEQLRQCIQDSVRGQSPAGNAAPPPAGARVTGKDTVLQPTVPRAGVQASGQLPKSLQLVDCGGVTPFDQPFCIARNTALVDCSVPGKYPDRARCAEERLASAAAPVAGDCTRLPEHQRARCNQRNKVFTACQGDRLGYFACLDTKLRRGK